MALKVHKIVSIEGVNRFLVGGIQGGVDIRKDYASLYLAGKTLITTTPSHTITFAGTPGAQVRFKPADVLAAISAGTGGAVIGKWLDGRLVLTATAGVTLAATGTANAQLGFSPDTPTVGTVYAPPDGVAPRVINVGPGDSGHDGTFLVLTEES